MNCGSALSAAQPYLSAAGTAVGLAGSLGAFGGQSGGAGTPGGAGPTAGVGSGAGGNTSTVVTQNQPAPQFMAAYLQQLARAQGVANQPLQQYTGPMVAGFTPAQQTAFDTINNSQGVGQP